MPSMKTAAIAVITLMGAVLAHNKRDACAELSGCLPGKVSFPNSTMYELSNTYWSERQAEVHPSCFVSPMSASDVSIALTTLIRLRTPFTVKGGGHTAFPGGSNIEDGVTIDMALMNDVVVSQDRQTVSVGPGTRWLNISEALDPIGLAVVAGRVGDVGVPGLVLGGGISYFSGMRGWACDNVRAYEIVVASGNILTASPTENQDLYWDLRGGGGSNFGIVTRFDLEAFAQGGLWEQAFVLPGAVVDGFLPLFQDLVVNGLPMDPEAHTFFAYSYIQALGGYSAITNFYHASHAASEEAETTIPNVFQQLQSVPSIVNTTSIGSITERSIEIREEYGFRKAWWDATLRATDPQLLLDIIPLFHELVSTMNSTAVSGDGVPEVSSFLVFQPISTNIIQAMQKNGGNALGLSPSDGPLMMLQLSSTWDNPAHDQLVESETRKTLDRITDMAEERGLLHPFKYMNYAGSDQDVFAGYGSENKRKLRRIARKYDRRNDLQRYWMGYFQIRD